MHRNPIRTRAGLWILLVMATPAALSGADAQPDARCIARNALPAGVGAHVPASTCAIAAERGDADGDGRDDYVVVLHRPGSGSGPGAREPRSLLLLTGSGDGLRLAAQGRRAVLCPGCGGAFGDPFEGVAVEPGEITVFHYGGAGWRWRTDFTFRRSSDGAWRLARVSQLDYHSGDPEKTMERRVHEVPDDDRAPALEDFDAGWWMEKEGAALAPEPAVVRARPAPAPPRGGAS